MSDLPISKQDMAELMRLAQTDAGKKLLAYLRKTDSQRLRKAMTQAASGDLDQAKQIAKQLLSSPEARALLEQLGR